MHKLRFASPVLCAAVLACGDTAAPTMADVAGSYSATLFTTIESGVTTDQLAHGALLTMVLMPDGATTGRLFVPGGGEAGGDLDADLAGSWVLHEDSVEFSQTADTFVRDMPFVFANAALSGEATFSGAVLRVVMKKQ